MGMIAIKLIELAIYVTKNDWSVWVIISALAGASAGFIIFYSASMTRYRLGSGDIKYSTVAGFVLGFGRYLWAMLIGLAAALLCSLIIKKIKGSHTYIELPLAPFISFGLIVILLI